MPKPDPNDISTFKKPERVGVLSAPVQPAAQPATSSKPKAANKPKSQKLAKTKVSNKERRTVKITLYLTEEEKAQLDADAGMVPLTKYLVAEMKDKNILPR